MGSSVNNKASELLDKQKKQRTWLIAIICLAAVVIFGTVAMLRYIGRAMTGDLTCTTEEHTHSMESGCYVLETAADGSTLQVLACDKPEHVHTDECYSQEQAEDAYDEEKVATIQARFDELPDVEAYLALSDEERAATDAVISVLLDEYEALTDNERDAVDISRAINIYAQINSPQTLSLDDGEEVTADGTPSATNVTSAVSETSVSNDLGQYITNVYGTGTVWDDKTGLLKETGLAVEISVPKDIVAANKNVMVYNYPAGIVVPDTLLNDAIPFRSGVSGTQNGECTFNKNADGTYSVQVYFYDSFVNSVSDDINGYIRFDGYLTHDAIDDKGNVKVEFDDKHELYVEGSSIKYNDDETLFYDIKTEKTGSYSHSDDTVTYTVTVSSEKGTPDTITISDVLSTNGLIVNGPESVTVKYSDTGAVTELSKDSYKVENSDGSVTFTTELQGLPANSYCELTYTYRLVDVPVNKRSVFNNTVTASSEDKKKGEIVKSSKDCTVAIEKEYKLKKDGSYNSTDKKIDWTITINDNERNIAGGILTDSMFGELTDKDFTIEPSVGYSFIKENGKITGIKFDGIDSTVNKNTYVIKYSTDASEGFEGQYVKNTADFDKDGDGKNEASTNKTVYVPGASISKKMDNAVVSSDGKTAEVTWNVTIGVKSDGIKAGTVIDDRTYNEWDAYNYKTAAEHYMTVNQVREWAGKLSWSGSSSYIDASGEYIELTLITADNKEYSYKNIGSVSADTVFSGWKIKVLKDIEPPKGSDSLTLTYKTTADISSASNGENRYYNRIYSGNLSSEDTYTYKKGYVVKKGKGDNGFTDEDTTITNSDGELTWTVEAFLSSDETYSELTFTDELPEGVELENVSVSAQYNYWCDFGLAIDKNGTISGKSYALTAEGEYGKADGKVSITIKTVDGKAFQNDTLIKITYICKTDDTLLKEAAEYVKDDTSKEYKKEFTNKVTVTTDKGKYGSDDSTLEWSYVDATEAKKYLDKSGDYDDVTSELNYTVVINPDGEDLIEGSDTLNLTDTLSYPDKDEYTKLRMYTLLPGTVRLYKAVKTADGSFIAGDAVGDWTWTASTEEKDAIEGWYYDYNLQQGIQYSGHNIESAINAVIPDGTPLILQYTYTVYAQTSQSDLSVINWDMPIKLAVTNKVVLDGISEYTESSTKDLVYKDASASAAFDGARSYSFYKVEEGNFGTALSGAEFKAYEEGDSASVKTYTTDTEGTFQIVWKDGVYEKDKLYYVTETKAPTGYKLPEQTQKYYFYFSEKTQEELAESGFCIPEGETALNLMEAGTMQTVENEKVETTSVEVSKKWLDAKGNKALSTPDSISFVLYSSTSSSIQKDDQTKEAVGRFVLTADAAERSDNDTDADTIYGGVSISYTGEWAASLAGLPVYNDDNLPLYYWIEEDDVPGYAPEYSIGSDRITSGSIEITNSPYTYSLPKTGSVTAAPLYAAGTALLAAAWGMFDIKARKQGKRSKQKQNKEKGDWTK